MSSDRPRRGPVVGGPGAVFFDCDGVIADTEPLHLRVFQEVLAPLGITLTPAEYAARYLGLDDRGVFTEALRVHGIAAGTAQIAGLMAEKARRFRGVLVAEVRIYPGVVALVRAFAGVPRAVVSGALREEVALVLRRAGIADAFVTVVAAEDVPAGKPDPAGYLSALATVRASVPDLRADACLVVEDSVAGVEAARRAGMRCLAVTNSYAAAELAAADLVVHSLEEVDRARVAALFG